MSETITARWHDGGQVYNDEGRLVDNSPILVIGQRVEVIETRDTSHPSDGKTIAFPVDVFGIPRAPRDGSAMTVDGKWSRLVGYGTVRSVNRWTGHRLATCEVEMEEDL